MYVNNYITLVNWDYSFEEMQLLGPGISANPKHL